MKLTIRLRFSIMTTLAVALMFAAQVVHAQAPMQATKPLSSEVLAMQRQFNELLHSNQNDEKVKQGWHDFEKKMDWTQLEDIVGSNRVDASFFFEHLLDSDYNRLAEVMPKLSLNRQGMMYYREIHLPYEKDLKTPEFLLPYSTAMIKVLERSAGASGEEAIQPWLFTHAMLLYKTGKLTEAYPYAKRVFDFQPYEIPAHNELYVKLLLAQNKDADLSDLMEKCFRLNTATSYMLGVQKSIYVKKHGNDTGFGLYISQLRPKDRLDDLKKYMSEHLINVKLSDFSLKDQHGNTVDSKKLLGKVVVLDFWATWCLPCKASFEGMKLAVDEYRGDKEVKFYFASTQETEKDYKSKIDSYLKEKMYDFDVLYDETDVKTKSSVYNTLSGELTKAGYNNGGIPLKLFFDKAGKCRFMEVGYRGSPMGLADEVAVIIETLRKVN